MDEAILWDLVQNKVRLLRIALLALESREP